MATVEERTGGEIFFRPAWARMESGFHSAEVMPVRVPAVALGVPALVAPAFGVPAAAAADVGAAAAGVVGAAAGALVGAGWPVDWPLRVAHTRVR